jgi:hypothetical protein
MRLYGEVNMNLSEDKSSLKIIGSRAIFSRLLVMFLGLLMLWLMWSQGIEKRLVLFAGQGLITTTADVSFTRVEGADVYVDYRFVLDGVQYTGSGRAVPVAADVLSFPTTVKIYYDPDYPSRNYTLHDTLTPIDLVLIMIFMTFAGMLTLLLLDTVFHQLFRGMGASWRI